MVYNRFGKTELNVSRFGLGCMRFPAEEAEAIRMVRRAIDSGVNYLDTAYAYGNSEVITGKALKDGYRAKTYLATKNPVWNVKKHGDFEKYLDDELVRLGVDYIDVYLLHNLTPEHWEIVKRYDGFTFMDKMVEKGKIRHKAFSAHTTTKAFQEIVDAFDWEMAQLQLNILDEHNQVGVEGMRYAAGRDIAVTIMEPLRGGYLVNNIPAPVQKVLDSYPEKRSLAEWCFRWLYNKPEVGTILSGTSTMEQLEDNLRIFEDARAGVMSESDLAMIAELQEAFESIKQVGCTGCRYCMPCPSNVNIPKVFQLYNNYQRMKPHWIDKSIYKSDVVSIGEGAENCTACGLCAQACPQGLDIPNLLTTAHGELNG